jgi:hypothetical protein
VNRKEKWEEVRIKEGLQGDLVMFQEAEFVGSRGRGSLRTSDIVTGFKQVSDAARLVSRSFVLT